MSKTFFLFRWHLFLHNILVYIKFTARNNLPSNQAVALNAGK